LDKQVVETSAAGRKAKSNEQDNFTFYLTVVDKDTAHTHHDSVYPWKVSNGDFLVPYTILEAEDWKQKIGMT